MTAGGTPVKNEDGADNVPETETHKTRFEKDREDRARKPARGSEPFEKWEREEMENLLGELRGHLGLFYLRDTVRLLTSSRPVVYSNRFLEGEDIANNFLFNADRYESYLFVLCFH
jgi:phospholipase D1/2